MWQAFLAPAVNVVPGSLTVLDPYWGGVAAEFAWNHASLPGSDEERFGGSDGEELVAELISSAIEGRDGQVSDQAPLTDLARHRGLIDAVDLLWAAAMDRSAAAEAGELAGLAVAALAYAERHPRPGWLGAVGDDREFLARLLDEAVPAVPAGSETFGGGAGGRRAAVGRLREGLGRVASAVPRGATTGVLKLTRSRTHRSVSVFLGDVLCYLRQREANGAQAPIASTVAAAIEEASRARTADDSSLVVVAHSMGGNIVYDLLSHLRTDLTVDILVTVGSQVGVFAELGLLPAVSPPADPAVDRVPPLPNVGRWLNVFDGNDVLAFTAGRIFHAAEDFRYSTGRGLLHAHSAYFLRPSFHRTLAACLTQPGTPLEPPGPGNGGA
jgi:hypothetical protein